MTQRGEADVKAAMRAQGSRDRSNLLRRCQSGDRGLAWASVLSPEALAGLKLVDAGFRLRDAAVELGERVRPRLRVPQVDAQRLE